MGYIPSCAKKSSPSQTRKRESAKIPFGRINQQIMSAMLVVVAWEWIIWTAESLLFIMVLNSSK